MRQDREAHKKKEVWNDEMGAWLHTHQPALIDLYKKSELKLGPVSGVWSHATCQKPPPKQPSSVYTTTAAVTVLTHNPQGKQSENMVIC